MMLKIDAEQTFRILVVEFKEKLNRELTGQEKEIIFALARDTQTSSF
ncbi:hypothetical protein ACE1TH_05035 [Shouchella sp. JSM 1781072]